MKVNRLHECFSCSLSACLCFKSNIESDQQAIRKTLENPGKDQFNFRTSKVHPQQLTLSKSLWPIQFLLLRGGEQKRGLVANSFSFYQLFPPKNLPFL